MCADMFIGICVAYRHVSRHVCRYMFRHVPDHLPMQDLSVCVRAWSCFACMHTYIHAHACIVCPSLPSPSPLPPLLLTLNRHVRCAGWHVSARHRHRRAQLAGMSRPHIGHRRRHVRCTGWHISALNRPSPTACPSPPRIDLPVLLSTASTSAFRWSRSAPSASGRLFACLRSRPNISVHARLHACTAHR